VQQSAAECSRVQHFITINHHNNLTPTKLTMAEEYKEPCEDVREGDARERAEETMRSSELDTSNVDRSSWGTLGWKARFTSSVWKIMKIYSNHRGCAKCTLCDKDVSKGDLYSTTKLQRHIDVHHEAEARAEREETERKKLSQPTMDTFLEESPTYAAKALDWVVTKFRPLSEVKDPSFRAMVRTLNPKVTMISKAKILTLANAKAAKLKVALERMMKGQHVSFTTDGWTSIAKTAYVAVTAHWIDEDWELISVVLSCRKKEGRATAADHLVDFEDDLAQYSIDWDSITAVVTDTEPTMNSFGRLVVEEGILRGDKFISHQGCVDHVLETITRTVQSLD
jgi:hypothetical protein